MNYGDWGVNAEQTAEVVMPLLYAIFRAFEPMSPLAWPDSATFIDSILK